MELRKPTSLWRGFLAAAIAVAASIAGPSARADVCETSAGSQQYTDQGCNNPGGNAADRQAKPAGPPRSAYGLREQLQRALANPAPRAGGRTSAAALGNAITAARDDVQRTLDRAATTFDPQELAKARRDYSAALTRLDRAYDAAINAASADGASQLREMKQNDQAAYAANAQQAGIAGPAQVQTTPAPQAAAAPATVTATNGLVYVCDGAVAGGNVSCRQVSADGRQCLAVTLADGVVGWQDSIATPCRPDDLARRRAFLAANPDVAAMANNSQAAFGMDSAGTAAAIARLNAEQAPKSEAEEMLANMGAECRAIVQRYIAASEAKDESAALTEYAAMRDAGGCNVLRQAERQAAGGDGRFISRGERPLLDETFKACDQELDACRKLAIELREGTSSGAVTAMYANAINVGLRIGTMLGGALPRTTVRPVATRAAAAPAGTTRAPISQGPVATGCGYGGCNTAKGPATGNLPSDITGLGAQ